MKSLKQLQANLKSHLIIKGGQPGDDGLAAQLTYCSHAGLLRVIASWGEDWEHVSVSLPNRCPTWYEMCFVKDFFFHPSECVIQYHPPEADYINYHAYCLHLWRPQKEEVPMPPKIFV